MQKEKTRVRLELNRHKKTWEGKVLYYLNNNHPGKKDGALALMELASAMWLPYAMRFFGASKTEIREAAMYSVRFFLAQAYTLVNEFGLTGVTIPGVVEPLSAHTIPIYSSIDNASTEYSSNGNSESNTTIEVVRGNDIREDEEEEEQEEQDSDEVWDFTELESGFHM
ncbi:hypothetical protein CAL7716_100580 (plasmid) [Calothrix sp. PCC 7716]|nr:hypothetical protein CAL7716_100580 [Calothrix sp. PCC 7716]